ncbi:MAG: nitrophenyl compound nitroreductase subunit ArsF family protein [Thermoguttaceae bacterium]
MKLQKVVTVALLLFVVASLGVMVANSLRPGRSGDVPADGVVAYFFHGKVRCPTCRNIEAYAHEAIQDGFAEQIEAGRVHWRVVDYEEPQNEHFATDFELVSPTVVLVTMEAGQATGWRNLMEVWNLVSDKGAFLEFLQQQVCDCLEEAG